MFVATYVIVQMFGGKDVCWMNLLGRKQEEHHRGGVVGEKQTKTDLHARHDKERLGFLHVGFPED